MEDAVFREKLRTMGKSSKAKFSRLATMFSRRGGGAGKLLGHAPAPSRDNLLLNSEPLVNCRDSEEESEGEERHSTTKVRPEQQGNQDGMGADRVNKVVGGSRGSRELAGEARWQEEPA